MPIEESQINAAGKTTMQESRFGCRGGSFNEALVDGKHTEAPWPAARQFLCPKTSAGAVCTERNQHTVFSPLPPPVLTTTPSPTPP